MLLRSINPLDLGNWERCSTNIDVTALQRDQANLRMLFGKFPMQTKQVVLFTREAALDANDLHRVIHLWGFHVSDSAGNVQDELEYFRRTRQCFWRSMDFACEHAMQEMTIEVFLSHLVDLPKHGLALRFTGLKHDDGDAAAVGPVDLL